MEDKTKKIINVIKKTNSVVSVFVILFLLILAAGISYLFVKPISPRIKGKIKKDIEEINIQLDKESIKELETRETFGEPLNTSDVGRPNMFLVQ